MKNKSVILLSLYIIVILSIMGCTDKEPPKGPIIKGVTDGKTYVLEGITPDVVNREEGVSYVAFIDGKPYELGKSYKVEGDHILKVVATKENNDLTSESILSFSIDLTSYTKEEYDYFKEISLGSEYGGTDVIQKWTNDINIKVNGKPNYEDINTLINVVNDLNEIIKTIDINIIDDDVEGDGDIDIYFIKREDFEEYLSKNIVQNNWAVFSYFSNDNYEIYKAKVLIPINKVNQKNRNHLIREELTQALGMGNDSYKYEDSVFQQAVNFPQRYLDIDKKVIEILYRDDVKAGMDESDLENVLGKRIVSPRD